MCISDRLKKGEAQIEMIQKQIDTLTVTYNEKKKEYETANAQALAQKAQLESQIAEKQKNLDVYKRQVENRVKKISRWIKHPGGFLFKKFLRMRKV